MSARRVFRVCAGGNGARAASLRIARAHVLANLPAAVAAWQAAAACPPGAERERLASVARRLGDAASAAPATPESRWCAASDGYHHPDADWWYRQAAVRALLAAHRQYWWRGL